MLFGPLRLNRLYCNPRVNTHAKHMSVPLPLRHTSTTPSAQLARMARAWPT